MTNFNFPFPNKKERGKSKKNVILPKILTMDYVEMLSGSSVTLADDVFLLKKIYNIDQEG